VNLRRITTGLAAVPVVAGLVLIAPQAASAEAQPGSLAGAGTITGTMANNQLSVVYGYAVFNPNGEHLYACDTRADGRSVTAHAYWNGADRARVTDGNGARAGCGHRNLSIAEGTQVWLALCVQGIGCTSWSYAGRA
jgi:hypothetical protein